jgi:hypothetical protein
MAEILPHKSAQPVADGMHPVYRIDVARKVVTLYWTEFPTLARLREVVEDAITDPEFSLGMNFLWDRKPGAPNPATTEFMHEALYFLQVLAEQIGPHSWAIVAHNPSDYGKARMLESMSEGSKVIIRAFHSTEGAEEWLRKPLRYEAMRVHFPARDTSSTRPELT